MKQENILVIGSSGTVGSNLVKDLRALGYNVRETTSKKPQDSQTVQINLATQAGLKEAFAGIDNAFILSPPGYADQYQILSPAIKEAKASGVKKVVLMTAMGANADQNNPFRKAEVELEKSGLTYNIIRPNWFMQNFNTFWLHGILEFGKILLPAGRAKTSFIDSRDISDVAAKLLTTSQFDNKDFDLTGPQALDHDEVAKLITEGSGKKVAYQEITPDEFRKGLLGAGLPADYAEVLVKIIGFLREGYSSAVTTSVKDILGRDPRSFKEYVSAYKKSWL